MRRLSLALLIAVTACSGGGGSWPSLARRPIEGPLPVTAAPRRCLVATGAASCLPPAATPTEIALAGDAPAVVPSAGAASTTVPTATMPTVAPTGTAPAGAAAASSLAPSAPVVTDDVAAKLAVIDRDLTDAAARLAAQRTAATAAVAAARGAEPSSAAWAKAQLEQTALDRIGNQVGDIRARLDAVAGTLAAASAGGANVAALLTATGRLIARATALTADDTTAATPR